jgi:hypothetical protein
MGKSDKNRILKRRKGENDSLLVLRTRKKGAKGIETQKVYRTERRRKQ